MTSYEWHTRENQQPACVRHELDTVHVCVYQYTYQKLVTDSCIMLRPVIRDEVFIMSCLLLVCMIASHGILKMGHKDR